MNCEKFLDHPIFLSMPYGVRSDASPDAFSHFMEILNGPEPQFSPQIADDLMLLAREFGYNGLLASFAPRQHVPSGRENARVLLQELGRFDRHATLEADVLLMSDSLTVAQRDIWGI
jgi:hypothetical protein